VTTVANLNEFIKVIDNEKMMHMMMMNGDETTRAMDALFEEMMGDACGNGRCGAFALARNPRERTNGRTRDIGVRDVRVEETKRGYLITASAPGVKASDVEATVETDASANAALRVKVNGKNYDLALPMKYLDTSVAPKASCIDGVLRVAILKKTPSTFEIPVSDEYVDSDMHVDDDTSSITLRVPGFGARDITVTLHKPEDVLTVKGQSKHGFGTFTKTFKNLPAAIETQHISAACAHGILTIKLADPDEITPLDIVVSNVALDERALANKVVLFRRAVPGTSADKITCALSADRVLKIEAKTAQTHASVAIAVPRDVDYSTIQAACAHGILTVMAERDASANASRSVRVEVSGEHIAALIEPSKATPASLDAAQPFPSVAGQDNNAAVITVDGVTIEDVPM